MATLLKVDGTTQQVRPERGSKFTLEELQGYVGGYIEILHLDIMDVRRRSLMLIINEEGKLNNLHPNDWTTCLFDVFSKPLVSDYIAGPALLVDSSEVD